VVASLKLHLDSDHDTAASCAADSAAQGQVRQAMVWFEPIPAIAPIASWVRFLISGRFADLASIGGFRQTTFRMAIVDPAKEMEMSSRELLPLVYQGIAENRRLQDGSGSARAHSAAHRTRPRGLASSDG
jgi:hypothetical protein